MSHGDAWMPFYVGDYLADTGHLRTVEHGAYLLLICHYWRTGPLPDDAAALSRIARLDRREAGEVLGALRPMFQVDNGLWRHKRIDAERARSAEMASKAAEKREADAERLRKWRTKRASSQSETSVETSVETRFTGISSPVYNHNHNHSISPTATPSERGASAEPRGTRLSADWQPSQVDRAFAEARGLDASRVAEKFRNYWAGKAGKDARKADWPATWRNWCIREAETSQRAPPQRESRLGNLLSHFATDPDLRGEPA